MVGWVAGLNEIKTNSAKLGLTGAEFGKKKSGIRPLIFYELTDCLKCKE